MGRKIQPARNIGTGVPSVLSVVYTTGQTFKKGALLTYAAAGTVSECGADPATVAGVALEAAASKPGFDAANSPTVVTGRVQEVSMAVADRHTVFSCRGINGGTDPLTPTQTMINEQYGVAKVGDDWVLDQAETTATIFEIVDIDIDNKLFFVKFMESRIELP
jgi:hypothetical protein